MPWMTVAAVAGSSLLGASMQSGAAQSAADTQAAATRAGIGEQGRQFDLTRSDTAPYRATGVSALEQLRSALGMGSGGPGGTGTDWKAMLKQGYAETFRANPNYNQAVLPAIYTTIDNASSPDQVLAYGTQTGVAAPSNIGDVLQAQSAPAPAAGAAPTDPTNAPLTRKFSVSDFWNDPVVQASYQSGLDLGTKALKNAAPLTTGLDSGAAMKELTKFGTEYTGNMAAGSQARFVGDQTNQFNKLATLAGVGQTGVATAASAGTNAANNTSQMLTSQGNAQGAAQIAGANAWGGGLQSISNWWGQKQMMDTLKNAGGFNNGYFGTGGAYSPSQATYNTSMYGY